MENPAPNDNESANTATGRQDEGGKHAQKPAAILAVAAFAAFLATFNETFLNVGFAPIMTSLDVDVSTVQWLATAYMLGAAVMVPVSAFAYRSFPTRPLFCATTALLVIGSVVGGLAQNFAVLLTGRIIQALGTGMLIPIGMNITLEVAPREKLRHLHGHHGRHDHAGAVLQRHPGGPHPGGGRLVHAALDVRSPVPAVLPGRGHSPARHSTPHASAHGCALSRPYRNRPHRDPLRHIDGLRRKRPVRHRRDGRRRGRARAVRTPTARSSRAARSTCAPFPSRPSPWASS